jgi:alkylation response protein AidB-like acyl-CoA dehydrogenase
VKLTYDADHASFRDSLRRFVAECAPTSVVREALETAGHNPRLWQRLCREFGLPGLRVPIERGGEGFGLVETDIALQELARALTPVPLLASALAVEAILAAARPDHASRLLAPMLTGTEIGCFAGPGQNPFTTPSVRVSVDGALEGVVNHVLHGLVADVVVLPARAPDETVRLCVARMPAVRARPEPSLDLLRPLATLEFANVPAEMLDAATPDFEGLHDRMRVLIAADALGAAEQCLVSTVKYASTRVQFNRPIGSFQAVKHRCAELAVELDASRATLLYAIACAEGGRSELDVIAPVAKAQATDTLTACAAGAMQLAGGIGFTWEHDAHLYLRRARSTQVLWGTANQERELSARRAALFD